jgi:hypothetical protein
VENVSPRSFNLIEAKRLFGLRTGLV